ncbi:MAG: ROK family transcriptional regulator [Deinococcota bacterium]
MNHDLDSTRPKLPQQAQLMLSHTEKRALLEVRSHKYLSRADLVHMLGFSKSTVSTTINKLIQLGLLEEHREKPAGGQVGQPALRLNIVPDALRFVGLNVSTRGIFAAVCNFACEPLWISKPAPLPNSAEDVVHMSQQLVAQAFEQAGCQTDIGIYIPGALSPDGDILELTPKQQHVPFDDVVKGLSQAYPESQILASNASDILLQALEPDNHKQVIFLVSMADGVGATTFNRDQIFRGGFNQASNFGGLIPETGPRPSLPDLAAHMGMPVDNLSLDYLDDLFRADNQALLAWIEDRGKRLSQPLSAVVQLINPNKIVFGGNFPASILAALIQFVDLSVYDLPNRLPVAKPELSVARVVGDHSRTLSAATIPIAQLLYESV